MANGKPGKPSGGKAPDTTKAHKRYRPPVVPPNPPKSTPKKGEMRVGPRGNKRMV